MLRSSRPAAVAALAAAAAVLAAAVPATAQYRGFGKNKVHYQTFDWRIYHSPHFDVHYYPEEEHLLQKVVSFAESAYDQLSRELDFQIQKPTPLIFYATHSAFEQNNIILNFISEGVGAFASPARNRMVLPVDLPDPELMKLVLHELTHIFQYHILYQGSLGRAAASQAPQWLIEGMASYMAKDEEAHDKMVLRDAVVNDNVPPVAEGNTSGYFAYRVGHAVFDFIEERWGREGVQDFLYEFRNTLGSRPGRAIQRAFRIDPEDFDLEFRRWLRERYLRELIETGEPSDFGLPFFVKGEPESVEVSAAASPSGDLVAAFSARPEALGEVDIVLFDGESRRRVRNLTRGFANEYQYLVAQSFEVRRQMGHDLAFSPDGKHLAVFARRDAGRDLLLLDVEHGGIARSVAMEVEQQVGLAWSPDGKTIAFAGNRDGAFDLYLLDLETEAVTQLTDDPVYDASPAFSPDGRSLVWSSLVGEHAKLFRLDLADPGRRYQLTGGESNDRDAVYSLGGERVYFTSDRGGYDNIFALELATGRLLQYTDAVTGCFQPAVLRRTDGTEKIVFGGLWDGRFKLYLTDREATTAEPELVSLPAEPGPAAEVAPFSPAIEVSIDEANQEPYGGYKFFLEDAQTYLGVDDDQTYLAQIYLSFSDHLGDRRLIAILSSYDALSNFDLAYWDLSERWQWGVNVFDSRDFYDVTVDPVTGQILDARNEIRHTGVLGSLGYPFGFSTRFELAAGYVFRKLEFETQVPSPEGGSELRTVEYTDDFPRLAAALVGDAAIYAPWGPISGRRWRIDGVYDLNVDDYGTLAAELSVDFRQYWATTPRTGVAARLFAGAKVGDLPVPFYVGGDNIRSFGYRELNGDRVGIANLELRFPVIDLLATPVLRFQGIRGRVFLDVAAVYSQQLNTIDADGRLVEVDNPVDFDFWNDEEDRLQDGIAVYGLGFTVRFLGVDLNWDIGKQWDTKETLSDGFVTTFFIGARF